MRYYLDTEFNEFGGQLLSMGIVREDNESLYITYVLNEKLGSWVEVNVVPLMISIPSPFPGTVVFNVDQHNDPKKPLGPRVIQEFFKGDSCPTIITDWPDDIKYFCQAIMTGPGEMISMRHIKFEMVRGIQCWPNDLAGAVQHNAYWDAKVLKEFLEPVYKL